jgi:hypothetical protein
MAPLLLAPLLLASRCSTRVATPCLGLLVLHLWLQGTGGTVLLVKEHETPAVLLHAGASMLC